MKDIKELKARVQELKKKKGALILAHNYQIEEVQDIADFVGDSFALAQEAARCREDYIVFCGVHFMAESAKILAPEKTVLLPVQEAGCPLANMAQEEEVRRMRETYKDAGMVAYVNTTASVKALVDVCCTSSNALKVVESMPQEQIIFLPDKNLGSYVARRTDKDIILWDGYCVTHERATLQDVKQARMAHPRAVIAVHPECPQEVVDRADYVGGTAGILEYARKTDAETLIIGTEMGMLYPLKKENPNKTFYLLSPSFICPNMKKTTLERVAEALETDSTEISVPQDIAQKARVSLERMLAIQ